MESRDMSIFIVDDDEDDRLLIRNALLDVCSDTKLVFFSNGEDLLNDLIALRDDKFPMFILLDLNMPTMTGFDVLQALRASDQLRCIPVLVLSGTNYESAIRECYGLGANAFMSKPTSFTELTNMLAITHRFWLNTVRLPGAVGATTLLR